MYYVFQRHLSRPSCFPFPHLLPPHAPRMPNQFSLVYLYSFLFHGFPVSFSNVLFPLLLPFCVVLLWLWEVMSNLDEQHGLCAPVTLWVTVTLDTTSCPLPWLVYLSLSSESDFHKGWCSVPRVVVLKPDCIVGWSGGASTSPHPGHSAEQLNQRLGG